MIGSDDVSLVGGLRDGAPAGEPLVGSGDIQSLADLGNSFEIVRGMRLVPFDRNTVAQLAVVTLLRG